MVHNSTSASPRLAYSITSHGRNPIRGVRTDGTVVVLVCCERTARLV